MRSRIIMTMVLLVLLVSALFEIYHFDNADNQGEDSGAVAIGMAIEFSAHAASAHIARSEGWYQAEGISIKSYDSYVTGMALAAALAKGDIEIAYMCLIPAINAFANAKVPLKIISGTHKYGYGLLVNPEKVHSVRDLGRSDVRIGCAREGSPVDVLMQRTISKYRLDGEEMLKRVRRMPPPSILHALKTGQIDAGFLSEQYPTMGETMGLKILLTAKELWPEMQGSVVVAREELVKRNPEIVKKIVAVTQRATDYILEHPPAAAKIVAKKLQAIGQDIWPEKMGKMGLKFQLTPDVIRRSLQQQMECTTNIDPLQIQIAINEMASLGYIQEPFSAKQIIYRERARK